MTVPDIDDSCLNYTTLTCSYSAAVRVPRQFFPGQLNHNGTVFGGAMLAEVDRICGIVATRHASGPVTTASYDAGEFVSPVFQGEIVEFSASINGAWRSSMEVGVKVEAVNPIDGTRRHVFSAYFTFVAIDGAGKPREIPKLISESAIEINRRHDSEARRAERLKKRLKRNSTPPV